MFYSPSTKGFYDKDIHGENMPSDVLEITFEKYRELLDGQNNGKVIVATNEGTLALQDPPELNKEEKENLANSQRQTAYQTESDPLFFKAQRGEATIAEWQAKVAEIKTRYPKE